MTVFLIIAAIVYAGVTLGVALTGLAGYSIHKDLAEKYEGQARARSYLQDIADEQRDKARAAARQFTQAPLWPLQLIAAIGRVLAEARKGDDR